MSEALQKVVFFCRRMRAFIEMREVGGRGQKPFKLLVCRALSLCERDWSVCLSLFCLSLYSLPLNFPVLFFIGVKHDKRSLASFRWKKYISELSWASVFLGSAQTLDREGSVKEVDGV